MAGRYQLWLTDDKGKRIADRRGRSRINAALGLVCTRIANGIGEFTLNLPASFDEDLLQPDYMVQVWRRHTAGSQARLWRPYLIRDYDFATTDKGDVLQVMGPDVNDFLRRRIVASYSGLPQASKRGYADDVMKEVVSESMLDTGDPAPIEGTREWDDLSVAGDRSAGPIIEKSFAWQRLLTEEGGGLLVALAQDARENGTEVFFDVDVAAVSSSSITFEFRTYIDQPGLDITDKGVLFSQKQRNLQKPHLFVSYRSEVNYAYAGGKAKGPTRNVQQVADATRYGISQWNRCEGFADARNVSADDSVIAAGRALLSRGWPYMRFTAELKDVQGVRFGRDWDFGYKVRAGYKRREFDAIVRAISLRVVNTVETVGVRIDSVDVVR